MADEITLDKEVFKALAGDTRVSVLKSLMQRRKTQSELAKELNLAAPTIKDHLDILQKAQLVREVDDGHKWKYIELTVKGKSLLQPTDKRIMVLLGTSLFGVAAAGFLAYSKFSSLALQNFSTFAADNAAVLKAGSLPADAMIASGSELTQAAPLVSGEGANASIEVGRTALEAAAPSVSPLAADVAAQTFAWIPTPELAVLVICLVVFGLACGMWIKQTY